MFLALVFSISLNAAPTEPNCMMDMQDFTKKEIIKVSTGEVWKLSMDLGEFSGEALAELTGEPIRLKIAHKPTGFEASSIHGTTVTLKNSKVRNSASTIVCIPPPR